jgi:hypothetical protein
MQIQYLVSPRHRTDANFIGLPTFFKVILSVTALKYSNSSEYLPLPLPSFANFL